ncbi:MAG: stage IV sporulation protein A [Eubacteriales bacterium]|nr:stage IV sporulation protein A [Eubacteriales bacterium]
MESFQIYQDIKARTGGDIYIGVVGPVRTGKSTFIRRFMELLALPDMDEKSAKEIRDQLPLSGSGRMITTVEPKFIPKEAITVSLGDDRKVRVRLIDCVGFLVKDAAGHIEEGRERMVKTPWYSQEIPFHQAAQIGTRKVIEEHSTIGLVITSDGSFGEIPRENFLEAEEKTVTELKKQGKPFLMLVNSKKPYQEETQRLVKEAEEKYQITALAVNCEQLRREDITRILEKVLYEFPVTQVQFFIPKWIEMLPVSHPLKNQILEQVREKMMHMDRIRTINRDMLGMEGPYVNEVLLESVSLADGTVRVRVSVKDTYYYQMLSEMTGIPMESEYALIHTIKEFAKLKEEYVKVQAAVESVRSTGYGVVIPELSEIQLEEPAVIRQGSKYGVKIKSKSPSIHMIKANIETEIAPIVGTEQQARDLIQYIQENSEKEDGIWETNIFGKSIEQLVQDGIRSKIAVISEASQAKLQDTMQKIVNDSKGGMVCIII